MKTKADTYSHKAGNVWGHPKLGKRQEGFLGAPQRAQSCCHPDLGLLASRTVTKFV